MKRLKGASLSPDRKFKCSAHVESNLPSGGTHYSYFNHASGSLIFVFAQKSPK